MEVYVVGGAVRDELLSLPVNERDWVVVSGTAEELLRQGFRQVGKDFPVFLHPDSGEEYALARTEKNTGPGYHGFSFDVSESVTLEEDLGRRDLTINSIARTADGDYVDPYGGRNDIENRILRHTSPAFAEDPLRVLRVARFAARFKSLGFSINPGTTTLMRSMVENGELEALRPERIWQETEKALTEERPDIYFETLRDCGALAVVFPEIDALFGVPQPPLWHPEIDTGVHTLMTVGISARLSENLGVRFAALVHDLGKALTPADQLPSHRGHEQASVELIERLCERLPVPNRLRELAVAVARDHGIVHRAAELKSGTIMKLIERSDGIRRPQRFEDLLLACEADARGRTGFEENAYPQRQLLKSALEAALAVDTSALTEQAEGSELGKLIREQRLAAITDALK